MPPIRLGPRDLLEYNAAYKVILCRECRYAIQKSALQSHLLRHKIFRHERHSLLSSIAQLTILEPDDVPLPPPTSRPIKALPTISGYSCTMEGCGGLYASSKRMRRHQLEVHSISEADTPESTVRSVNLQTFFRGTKIKYFEVAPVDEPTRNASEPVLRDFCDSVSIEQEAERLLRPQSQMQDVTVKPYLPSNPVAGCGNFNLQSLVYFHHFLSETSSTLPLPTPAQPLYWETEFVNQALQQKWLMAGLLSLSASHKSTLAHQASTATTHHDQSSAFFLEFEEGRRSHTQDAFNTSKTGAPTPRKSVLAQISSIIVCAHVTFAARTASGKGQQPPSLQDILTPMRSLVPTKSALQPIGIPHNNDAVSRAAQLMSQTARDPDLTAVLDCLDALPTQMAEALGRPDDVYGVLVALSAIAALIESCVAGFESDEEAFSAMAMWLVRVGEEFHRMLGEGNAAALVVLAYWAKLLVERVEEGESWFLRGAARFVMASVGERLTRDAPAVWALVEDL